MKILFLDHDGVVCLAPEWGGRKQKIRLWNKNNPDKFIYGDYDANEIDVEYEEKINKTTQLKLQAIEEVKNTLTDPRQIDVFNQHIINRKSQRKLARENDINHYVIHRIAKKITQKIKNKYDELYKLQKQNTNTNDKSI